VSKSDGIARTLLLVKIGKSAGVDIEKLINSPPSIFSLITHRWRSGEMDDAAMEACLRQIVDINPNYKIDAESSEIMRSI
jgi:hypothetical protein